MITVSKHRSRYWIHEKSNENSPVLRVLTCWFSSHLQPFPPYQLELKKTLLDRMVHLLSRGYVLPVVSYIRKCLEKLDTDISLIRYFVTEVSSKNCSHIEISFNIWCICLDGKSACLKFRNSQWYESRSWAIHVYWILISEAIKVMGRVPQEYVVGNLCRGRKVSKVQLLECLWEDCELNTASTTCLPARMIPFCLHFRCWMWLLLLIPQISYSFFFQSWRMKVLQVLLKQKVNMILSLSL